MLGIFFVTLLMLTACSRGADLVPPMQDAVTDTAGKLTEADDRALEERIAAYRNRTGNEIAVLVIGTLGGESIEDVAYRVFNTWGIGQKGKDNGVLLMIAPEERKTRIETGKGIGHLLTDIECAYILRERVGPLLKEDRFKEAIEAALEAIEAALDGRPDPPLPSAIYEAPFVRGMYIVDTTGTLDDAAVANLEEEVAREGRLFDDIVIFVVPSATGDGLSANDFPKVDRALRAEVKKKRSPAWLNTSPMAVFIDPSRRVVAVPVTVIQAERHPMTEPRLKKAAAGASTLEEAIWAIAREQIELARQEDAWKRRRAAEVEVETGGGWSATTIALLFFLGMFVLGLLPGILGIWWLVRTAGKGSSSSSSSSSWSSSSSSSSSSWSSSSSSSSWGSSSSSSSTSYSGGGGSSGGGGASGSY